MCKGLGGRNREMPISALVVHSRCSLRMHNRMTSRIAATLLELESVCCMLGGRVHDCGLLFQRWLRFMSTGMFTLLLVERFVPLDAKGPWRKDNGIRFREQVLGPTQHSPFALSGDPASCTPLDTPMTTVNF